MKIKIIKSVPATGQDNLLLNVIGQEFEVLDFDEENEEVSVYSELYKGEIVLNKSEYEVVSD